eukprot:1995742-Rhodomonas_salina.1
MIWSHSRRLQPSRKVHIVGKAAEGVCSHRRRAGAVMCTEKDDRAAELDATRLAKPRSQSVAIAANSESGRVALCGKVGNGGCGDPNCRLDHGKQVFDPARSVWRRAPRLRGSVTAGAGSASPNYAPP